jgi:hypothetical protein
MWTYKQSTGELLLDGKHFSKGYSGHGRGLNNPKLQGVQGVGPLPVGKWKILGPYDSARVGKFALRLEAVDAHPGDDKHDGTDRGAFRMHGDNVKGDSSASNGCLIFPLVVRKAVWASGDRDLEAIP